jgi:hypothetical protein
MALTWRPKGASLMALELGASVCAIDAFFRKLTRGAETDIHNFTFMEIGFCPFLLSSGGAAFKARTPVAG